MTFTKHATRLFVMAAAITALGACTGGTSDSGAGDTATEAVTPETGDTTMSAPADGTAAGTTMGTEGDTTGTEVEATPTPAQ